MNREFGTEYPQSQSKETESIKPHVLVISGATATDRGMAGIQSAFEKKLGPENVRAFNSAVSKDKPTPDRYKQMAEYIKTNTKGGMLHVVAHSLGAGELYQAIRTLEKQDKDFFGKPETRQNLQFTLISPSGYFEGLQGAVQFLKRTRLFMSGQSMGIDSFTTFPPAALKQEELTKSLREVYPHLSQFEEGVQILPQQPERDYRDKLSDQDKQKLDAYDAMLQSAIENRKQDAIRVITGKRAELLEPYISDIYKGNYEPENRDKKDEDAMIALVPGALGLLGMFKDVLSGKPMKKMAELEKLGYDVRYIVPEWDVFLQLKELRAYLNGKPADQLKNVKVKEGYAHAYPALQPEEFVQDVLSSRVI